ncbi:MAG: hypothetical protein R2851_21870 [Caldilineaceae bacterium]
MQRIWDEDLRLRANLVCIEPDQWGALPFADNSFDFTWEWAGLWYINDPAGLLRELVRTSRDLVFVAMPNNIQVGYWMRKLVIDREFFAQHDEGWTDIAVSAAFWSRPAWRSSTRVCWTCRRGPTRSCPLTRCCSGRASAASNWKSSSPVRAGSGAPWLTHA